MPFAEFGVKIVKNGQQSFRRISYNIDEEEATINYYRKKYNNTDIFRSIFTYDSLDFSNALISGPLYFDIDFVGEDNESFYRFNLQASHCVITLQQYLKIPPSQINLYYSGHKGYHIIVPKEVLFLGFCDHKKLLKDYKDLAVVIKQEWENRFESEYYLDLRIYDHRRMFRIPNSFNSKGQRYKILLPGSSYSKVRYDDLRSMALNCSGYVEQPGEFSPVTREIWDLLTTEKDDEHVDIKRSHTKKKFKSNEILPCVQNIIDTPVTEGSRNNTAIILASALFQQDLSFEDVQNTVETWNENNNPPLSDYELYVTVKSAKNLDYNGKGYGCTSIKELGFCDKSCRLRGRKR